MHGVKDFFDVETALQKLFWLILLIRQSHLPDMQWLYGLELQCVWD